MTYVFLVMWLCRRLQHQRERNERRWGRDGRRDGHRGRVRPDEQQHAWKRALTLYVQHGHHVAVDRDRRADRHFARVRTQLRGVQTRTRGLRHAPAEVARLALAHASGALYPQVEYRPNTVQKQHSTAIKLLL